MLERCLVSKKKSPKRKKFRKALRRSKRRMFGKRQDLLKKILPSRRFNWMRSKLEESTSTSRKS